MQDITIPSDTTPIAFHDRLPDEVDVVIVGAGIIGVTTAYYLAKAGTSVLLCEKGRVAGEQSSRNWGWVRQQGRDADELPVMMEATRLWEELAGECGEDLGFAREGCLYLAETQADLDSHEEWLETAKQHQLDSRLISRAEVDRLIDGANGQWAGALYTPNDARAEPTRAAAGLARAAQRLGVAVAENCAVRSLDRQAGQVTGVVTEQGRVRCQSVLLAGGAWSGLFLGNLGIPLPQLTVRSSAARTGPVPEIYAGNAAGTGIAFRRRQDGGYSVATGDLSEHYLAPESFRYFRHFFPLLKASHKDVKLRFSGTLGRFGRKRRWSEEAKTPFEETRVLNPAASPLALRRIKSRLAKRLPALSEAGLAESWAGMIDVMPDAVPVMDELPAQPGLFVATGFSGHGFGIGPGAGRVMADLLRGKPAGHDLTRFRYQRFFDGSPIKVGPI